MILIGIFYVTIGFWMNIFIVIQAESLVIDPMSITVDPNLYRLCWKQFYRLALSNIEVRNEKHEPVKFQLFQIVENDQIRYCIEKRDRNLYRIKLPITGFGNSSKFMDLKIKFNVPLGPQLNIIQFRTLATGLYINLNAAFAGLDKSIQPDCNIILIKKLKSLQIFSSFTIKLSNETIQPIDRGWSFSFYYTCTVNRLFEVSSRFDEKHGSLDYVDKTKDLKPILQMPFRRFIKAAWRHPSDYSGRYDVAIYRQISRNIYKCVKVFRLFVHNVTYEDKSPKFIAENCNQNVPIEDLWNSNPATEAVLTVILDMVNPLRIYSLYKFSIFWRENSQTMSNYLHFNPLPNECIGNINKLLFDFDWSQYDQMKHIMPKLDQAVISKNSNNPYNASELNLTDYSNVELYSGIITHSGSSKIDRSVVKVSVLYKSCNELLCSRNIMPFFYALYSRNYFDGVIAEIVQLPGIFNAGTSKPVEQLEFVSNNAELHFTLSWKIPGYPKDIPPAMFGIEIRSEEMCEVVYILKCRSCNEIYIKNTYEAQATVKQIQAWKALKCPIKELDNQYYAADYSIVFKTNPMEPNTNYSAMVFSFKNNVMTKTEMIENKWISQSVFQKYKYLIIGGACAIVVAGVLLGIFLRYKRPAEDPKSKKSIPYAEKSEEIYDDDV